MAAAQIAAIRHGRTSRATDDKYFCSDFCGCVGEDLSRTRIGINRSAPVLFDPFDIREHSAVEEGNALFKATNVSDRSLRYFEEKCGSAKFCSCKSDNFEAVSEKTESENSQIGVNNIAN